MGRGRAIAPTGFTQIYSKRIGDEPKDIDESDEKQGNPGDGSMNKTKIFYVEDDETLAFLTTEALSNEGFQVDHFHQRVGCIKCL
jgi:hypothetical protein